MTNPLTRRACIGFFILAALSSHAGPAPYILRTELPSLPDGVRQAGEVELSVPAWLGKMRIPELQASQDEDGGVDFSKTPDDFPAATAVGARAHFVCVRSDCP